jgi:CHASE2 domain-containing sensor protein
MEVVLLWLDDLDDALFSVALAWEGLRRVVLEIGLASAMVVAVCELSAIATAWTPAFSGVAAASVLAWFVGTLVRAFYQRESRRYLTAA